MSCYGNVGAKCGIGTFSWAIAPPKSSPYKCNREPLVPTIPQPGPRVCTPYVEDDINNCDWLDVTMTNLQAAIDYFSFKVPKKPQKIDGMRNYTQVRRPDNMNYFLNIGHVEGCTKYEEQVVDNP